MTAYASIDDYISILETEITPGSRKAARVIDLLEVASEEINAEIGRDFFRHPSAGSETWVVDSEGSGIIHFHEGIASLDLMEYSEDYGATWTSFETGDWSLRGDNYSSTAPIPAGEPYFHLVLSPRSETRTSFPVGQGSVRLTGARGWATPPRRLVEATAQRARQLAYSDQTYSGGVPGPEEMNPYDYAQRLVSFRWPQVAWLFMRAHSRRFMACSL